MEDTFFRENVKVEALTEETESSQLHINQNNWKVVIEIVGVNVF